LSLIAPIVILLVVIAGTSIYFLFRKAEPFDRSIAILPFDNLSSADENQFFADGIVEDLLNRISKINGLKVISRTSSEMFRDKGSKTIPEIAELLGVSYILEGTVQQANNKVRINIQLIDAKKDNHILSKQYDRDMSEVFTIQSEIASQIATELSLVLSDQQLNALKQDQTKSVKAFELYQMGRFHSSKRWIDGYQKAIEYYEKAIVEDIDYALAYAGLSDTYHLMALQGWMDYNEGRNKSTELAMKALELDPNLAEPHAVLGDFYVYADWNWEKGEKELTQAIKLNPNFSTAHQYYSELLTIYGNNSKAREHINKALELDPYSFVIRHHSALFYYNQEQFKEALKDNMLCLDLIKDHSWAVELAFNIHVRLGDEDIAYTYAKKRAEQASQSTVEELDSIFSSEGIHGIIRLFIKNALAVNDKALYYAMLGEKEKTLEMLELAVDEKKLNPISIARLEYKFLHADPRFNAIRKKMGLHPL
jgi:TolB-like protein/Tfp pilus assembly protein PilF